MVYKINKSYCLFDVKGSRLKGNFNRFILSKFDQIVGATKFRFATFRCGIYMPTHLDFGFIVSLSPNRNKKPNLWQKSDINNIYDGGGP